MMVNFEVARLNATRAICAHIRTAESIALTNLAAHRGGHVSPRLTLAPVSTAFSAPVRSGRRFDAQLVSARLVSAQLVSVRLVSAQLVSAQLVSAPVRSGRRFVGELVRLRRRNGNRL